MSYYLDIGQGETLVFIHGLGNRKEAWNDQLELSKHFRLIVPDLRGHGEWNESDDISVAQFAKDIIFLLNKLGIRKAHFCGISLGGIIAQEIYKEFPERVSSLILSNTFSYSSCFLNTLFFQSQMRKIQSVDQETLHNASAKKCLYNQDDQTLFEKTKNVFLIRKDVYKTTSLSSLRSNYLSTLRKIDVPTLVIGSKEDKVVPYICSLQTHFLITGSEFHGFEKTGHLSNIEQKEEFNFLIRNFILKQRRRSA